MSASANQSSSAKADLELLSALRDRPVGTLAALVAEEGDTVALNLGPFRAMLVTHPDDVATVLVDSAANFSKETLHYHQLRRYLGEGLLTSQDENWRAQRRACQPGFRRDRLREYEPIMRRAIEEMLGFWRQHDQLDIHREMLALALRVVGLTLLGADLKTPGPQLAAALEQVLEALYADLGDFLLQPPRKLSPATRAALDDFDQLMRGLAQNPSGRGVLLDELRADKTLDLRNLVLTLFVAGHETSASTMAWCWHLLAHHPQWEARLHEEVAAGGQEVAEAIVSETLRLYPPLWLLPRRAETTTDLRKGQVEVGTVVYLCPFLTHRHPDFWPQAERFEPQRFLSSAGPRARCSYIPFGAGAQGCLGGSFAMLECRLILAGVGAHYRLRSDSEESPEPLAGVTLRPPTLELRVEPRQGSELAC